MNKRKNARKKRKNEWENKQERTQERKEKNEWEKEEWNSERKRECVCVREWTENERQICKTDKK